MRLTWLILIMALLVSPGMLAAEVTRTETYRPDGSVASVREVEPLADGETRITHTLYLPTGEACTVCHINSRGQVLRVINRIGEKIFYERDAQQRITSVQWENRTYLIHYGADGTIAAIRFPDEQVQAAQFNGLRWQGLQLLGEDRATGEKRVLIPDPLTITDEI